MGYNSQPYFLKDILDDISDKLNTNIVTTKDVEASGTFTTEIEPIVIEDVPTKIIITEADRIDEIFKRLGIIEFKTDNSGFSKCMICTFISKCQTFVNKLFRKK